MTEEFFPPPPPPGRKREPVPTPEWWAPPLGGLGHAEPVRLILGQSDAAVVAVMGLVVYSTGLAFRTVVMLREPMAAGRRLLATLHVQDPAPLLKLGMELPDGTRITSIDDEPAYESSPTGPLLRHLSGPYGMSNVRFAVHWWVWPLPRAGSVKLYCEWPEAGIDLTESQVDVTPILLGPRRA